VLVIDLDGFKNVNDHFGHLTGNQVLRRIGDGLRTAFSGDDYVARLGGDEFVVVLPGRDRIEVNAVIERLNALVEETGEEICGSPQLALSVGAAFYPRDGSSAEQLLATADEKMYQMKEEHRLGVKQYAAAAGRRQTAYVA
ncbi:MAG: GGDEF domain-containing protein, partial [Acidobacteriota bacterium]|nr:GGDEF domain-containing protein [Acidobacteriota bacterium]